MTRVKPPIPPPEPPHLEMPIPLEKELPPPSLAPPPRRSPSRASRPAQGGAAKVAAATAWQQIVAFVADGGILLAISSALAWLLALLVGDPVVLDQSFVLDRFAAWTAAHQAAGILLLSSCLVLGGVYAFYGTRRSGRTFGRLICGTVLIAKSGEPLGTLRAVLRALVVMILTPLAAMNFLFIVVDPLHRPLHDIIAGTIVVKRRPVRARG